MIPTQRDERVLVVWADGPDTIIPTCNDFEERLIKLLWRARPGFGATPSPSHPASYADSNSAHSLIGVTGRGSAPPSERRVPASRSTPRSTPAAGASKEDVEKAFATAAGEPRTVRTVKRRWYGRRVVVEEKQLSDAEDGSEPELGYGPEKRPALLYAPLYNGTAAGLAFGNESHFEQCHFTQFLFASTVFVGNGLSE